MGKSNSYPHVDLREQDGAIRPRFNPGPRERALGFKGQDLRHRAADDRDGGPPTGPWYNRDEAATWALDNLHRIREVRDAAAAGKPAPSPAAAPGAHNLVHHLLTDWLATMSKRVRTTPSLAPKEGGRNKRMETLSTNSLDTYKRAASAIMHPPMPAGMYAWPKDGPARPFTEIALLPLRRLDKPKLRVFHQTMWQERGLAMASLAISTLSSAITWAIEERAEMWGLTHNPRHGMKFAKAEGRISVYTRDEFDALVATADAIGRPSIGDMIFLGMFTGQRVTDRRLLVDDGIEHGRRVLRQQKTDRVVKIKEAPQLTARLAQSKARRLALQMKFGTRGETVIVLNELTGKPYATKQLENLFDRVRKLAAERVPSLAHRTNQDLRDTFVTSVYRAQMRAGRVDYKAIADCTGHTYASVAAIINAHYLGTDPVAADGAIDLFSDFFETDAMNEGITPR